MSTPSLTKSETIRKMALEAIHNSRGRTYENAYYALRAALGAIAVAAMIEEEKK